MEASKFDLLIAEAARRPTRRAALRLLSTGLLGALLPARIARAQRPDGDGDGLFDDDEANIYGTRADVFDTDGDGVGDGEEIWNRDQKLGGNTNPLVNENAAPPPADPAPPPVATCAGLGGACTVHTDCCPGEYVQCCPNVSGTGTCQDVSQTSFICMGWSDVPATGCPVGMTDCGGFCANLGTDHGNCGVCGQACPSGYNCVSGTCTQACSGGLTSCNGACVDVMSDVNHCGTCGFFCHGDGVVGECREGTCYVPF
jgi:hypothetical protein